MRKRSYSLYALIEIAITALIFAFAFLIVVIMTVFYTHTTKESSVTSMDRLVGQVNSNVGFYISDIIDVADYARNLVRTSSNNDLGYIQASFETIVASRDDLVRVALFRTDGSCIVSTDVWHDLPEDEITSQLWFSRAIAGEGNFFFTGPHTQPYSTHDELVLSYSQLISYGDLENSDRQAVLLIDIQIKIRHDSDHRNIRTFLEHGESRLQDGHISPELIDDHSFDTLTLLFLEQHDCPDKLCEHAAPVDIPGEQHRRVHQFRQTHIYDIILLQIDLRRASRSFDHDHIILAL